MRVKFTIAVCALLMLGLAVTQVNAQGFNVSKSETKVVQHGRNQMMGAIRLDYTLSGGNIDDGRTITVNYSNLRITTPDDAITNTADATGPTLECGGSFETNDGTCENITAAVANDKDTGVGTVTLSMGDEDRDATSFVILRGVRTDVSALAAGDKIVASINSSTAPTGFVPIGQERTESVGGTVSTVADGLDVVLGAASRLLCNLGTITDDKGTVAVEDDETTTLGGIPSITVSEGFATAWETALDGTMITLKMNNLPEGVNLRWPNVVEFIDTNEGGTNPWSTLTLTDASRQTAGNPFNQDMPEEALTGTDLGNMGAGRETDGDGDTIDANNGEKVTYEYTTTELGVTNETDKDVTTEKDSFKISFNVDIDDLDKVGAGGISDLWAWLAPAGKTGEDDDRDDTLSYLMMPDTDPKSDDGDVVNFGECVTYLLFPYLTCGDSANWTTAIAIANTTMDEGVFGISGGAAAQGGNIMLHAFPRSMMGEDGMMMMHDPMSMELTEDLAAGDTYSDTCSNIMPGFSGYAIARAGFRHAHGVAFVLGSFEGGATIDLAHGYLALVIPDPEFDNRGRGAQSGESLGQ